jgi:hypothetical protein
MARPSQRCVRTTTTSSCFTSAGVAFTYPWGLPATTDAAVQGWGDNNNIGARYYYIDGYSSFGCWDFTVDTTGSACAGFSQGEVLGNYVYAVTADPNLANCLWSNADSGTRIVPFHATTGALGCPAPASPEVVFPHERTAPRLACEPVPGATAWREFRLTLPPAASRTGFTLVLSDSFGNPVTGWEAIDLGTQGTFANGVVTLNLSALAVASTGASPEFKVITPSGTTNTDAESMRAEVTFDSAPPQLCFDLQVATLSCPSGTGLAQSATPPGLPLTLASRTVVTTSGVASEAAATNNGTVDAVSGCLGTVVGVAEDADGNPVSGVPVLFKTGSTTHATVNTNAAGHAVFTNVYPFLTSASSLEFQSSTSFRPVSQSAIVDLSALVASATVTGSAMTYVAVPPPPPPPVPTTTIPGVTTSTTNPPTTTTAPAASTTTTVPVLDAGGFGAARRGAGASGGC